MTSTPSKIDIQHITAVEDRQRVLPAIAPIFFAASVTQSFESDDAKTAFLDRWLGRYCRHEDDVMCVAYDRSGQHSEKVVGYVVGSFCDPSRDPRFSDIGFFSEISDLTRAYPAQLHINIDEAYRNLKIGGRLIDAFCDIAEARGCGGVHVVTGGASRNISFYKRNGFQTSHSFVWGGTQMMFLGRALSGHVSSQ